MRGCEQAVRSDLQLRVMPTTLELVAFRALLQLPRPRLMLIRYGTTTYPKLNQYLVPNSNLGNDWLIVDLAARIRKTEMGEEATI